MPEEKTNEADGGSKQSELPTSSAPVPGDAGDAADPDEDDLDDLDDMLDEFSAVNLSKKEAAASGPGRPAETAAAAAPGPAPPTATKAAAAADVPPAAGVDELSDEDFQKQLQAGMAEMMKDLEDSPDMQAQFENIFKGLGAAAADVPSSSAEAKSTEDMAADLSQDASFQDTIKRTMARMQESGDQATAAAATAAEGGGSEEDFLAEIMKAMKDMPGGGEGGEEDFSKMLAGMMEQLTNKEILYEPMRELNDKFPAWMAKNREALSADDLQRYQTQKSLVAEMVAKFEEPTYADSNAADREFIVDRMQKMQEAGSPPHDLVGDMPSAKEVLDAPDESCAPQ